MIRHTYDLATISILDILIVFHQHSSFSNTITLSPYFCANGLIAHHLHSPRFVIRLINAHLRCQTEISMFWGPYASSERGSISYLDERAPQDTLTCIFCPPALNIFVLMRALISQKMASIFAWRGKACFCLTVIPVNWLSKTIRSFAVRLLLWKLTHIGPMRFASFSEVQGKTCPSSSTSSSSLSSSSSCRVCMFGWNGPSFYFSYFLSNF